MDRQVSGGYYMAADYEDRVSQLDPAILDMAKNHLFVSIYTLIAQDSMDMVHNLTRHIDQGYLYTPDVKARLLYHALKLSRRVTLAIVAKSAIRKMKIEFVNIALQDGDTTAALKIIDAANIAEVPVFPIISIKYKNKIDDLIDLLEYLVEHDIITLVWLRDTMRDQKDKTNFHGSLYSHICEHFDLPMFSPTYK